VKKRQRRLTEVDEIVLSLYAKGLTTGEISAHFAEIYGASISKETISRITDKVARLNGSDLGGLYPGRSGVHGEVHGLNELLWRREAAGMSTAIDDSFGFYSVRLRGAQQGSQIPACAACVSLTS
jgi:hypothetical protein